MESFETEQPRKVSPDKIEVISDYQNPGQKLGQDYGQKNEEMNRQVPPHFANMKVIRGGPWMLLLLPVLIPILFVGFFILMFFALFFGRTVFRSIAGMRRFVS